MPRRATDVILGMTVRAAGAAAGAILLLIVGFLLWRAWPAMASIGPARFATDDGWYPTLGRFNLAPMAFGTLAVAAGSILIAAPLGVLSAVFARHYAPAPLAVAFRRMVELLAGIPSVVYGFWGLVSVAPWVAAWQPPGLSLLTGIFVLSLMILPTVVLFADAAMANVAPDLRRSAAALGLSPHATTWRVVVPAAAGGIATGILLAMVRAVGETMAVLMVCGNVVQTPTGLLEPVRTLTANIALEMGYALGDHRSALFVTGLVLLAMVATLVVLAEWVSRGRLRG